jgi:hypothetical protein
VNGLEIDSGPDLEGQPSRVCRQLLTAYAPSNTATTPAGTAGFCTLTRRKSSVNTVTVGASLVAAKRPNCPTAAPAAPRSSDCAWLSV